MADDDDNLADRKKNIDALFEALRQNEQEYAEKLVNDIIDKEKKEESPFEKMSNEEGDTALHVAASKGFAKLCKLMVDNDRSENMGLMKTKNQKGETPLFLAALSWHLNKYTFLYFIDKLEEKVGLQDLINNDGDNILHSAINLQYFDLAIIILDYYNQYKFSCATHTNKKGITPIQALANIPSAFRSGTEVFGWKLILYHCILVEPLDPVTTKKWILAEADERDWNSGSTVIKEPSKLFPKNYETLELLLSLFFTWVLRYFIGILRLFPESKTKYCFWLIRLLVPKFKFPEEYHRSNRQDSNYFRGWLPPNYNTFRQFINATVGVVVGLFGLGKFGYDGVKKKKCKHRWSRQVLKEPMKRPHEALYGHMDRPSSKSDTDVFGFPEIWQEARQIKKRMINRKQHL